jgi:N-acetyl-beta-hexosaminidase
LIGGVKPEMNGVLAYFIYRKENTWEVYSSSKSCPGKVFTECEDLIKSNLIHVGFDEVLLGESKAWTSSKG